MGALESSVVLTSVWYALQMHHLELSAYIANTRNDRSKTSGDCDKLCNTFIEFDVEDLPPMHTHTHTHTHKHTHTNMSSFVNGTFSAKIKSVCDTLKL